MIRTSDLDTLLPRDPLDDLLTVLTPAASKGMSLPMWHADPVARRYAKSIPVQQYLVQHVSFRHIYLYRNAGGEGGAVILCTEERTVLAMDFLDTAELDACWRESVRHYSSGLFRQMTKLA